jgi:hypothetical protein
MFLGQKTDYLVKSALGSDANTFNFDATRGAKKHRF